MPPEDQEQSNDFVVNPETGIRTYNANDVITDAKTGISLHKVPVEVKEAYLSGDLAKKEIVDRMFGFGVKDKVSRVDYEKAKKYIDESSPKNEQPEKNKNSVSGTVSSAIRGAGLAGLAAPLGPVPMAVVAGVGAVTDLLVSLANVFRKDGKKFMMTSEVYNKVLDSLGVERADTDFEKGVEMIASGATAGATFAGGAAGVAKTMGAGTLSGAINPNMSTAGNTVRLSAEQMAKNPGRQALSAGTGIVGRIAGEAVAEAFGLDETGKQVLGLAGDMIVGVTTDVGIDAVKAVKKVSKQAGTFYDMPPGVSTPIEKGYMPSSNSAVNKLKNEANLIPGGVDKAYKHRYGENVANLLYAAELSGVDVNNYKRILADTEPFFRKFADARAAKLTKNTTLRDEVIATVTRATRNKKGAIIPVDEALIKIRKHIKSLDDSMPVSAESKKRFWKELEINIQGKDKKGFSKDKKGLSKDKKGLSKDKQGLRIENAFNFRKNTLDDFRAAFNGDIPTDEEKLLAEVFQDVFGGWKRVVKKDGTEEIKRIGGSMDTFIKNNSDKATLTKYRVASKNLHQMSLDFKSQAMKQIVKDFDKGVPQQHSQQLKNLLLNGPRNHLEELYTHLDDEGRAVARQVIVAKWLEDSVNLGEEVYKFSPSKFALSIEKYADQMGVFFNQKDREFYKGMKRVFNITKESEKFVTKTPDMRTLNTGVPGEHVSRNTFIARNPVVGLAASILGMLGVGKLALIVHRDIPLMKEIRAVARIAEGSPQAQKLAQKIARQLSVHVEKQKQKQKQKEE